MHFCQGLQSPQSTCQKQVRIPKTALISVLCFKHDHGNCFLCCVLFAGRTDMLTLMAMRWNHQKLNHLHTSLTHRYQKVMIPVMYFEIPTLLICNTGLDIM